MIYKKNIFELTTNKLIFSKVKLTDMKRFSDNLVSQVSINFPISLMFTNFSLQSLCHSSSFLGIPNIANPLVALDFVHPNMEQFTPGILLVN